jgi:hypothetical protein
MNLVPFAIVWVVLLAVVLMLAFRRSLLARQEDDMLHVGDAAAAAATAHQVAVGKKLTALERLLKILAVLLILYGVALVGVFIYDAWMASTRMAG